MITFAELKQEIDSLLTVKNKVLLAIDGPCASGKTTLAKALADTYDCNVFHMDDFFLTPDLRTPERLSEIGGNVDYERFYAEVLLPLRETREFTYRPYDCRTQSLKEPIVVMPKKLNMIEGSYSMHPKLESAYDFSVFLKISPQIQRERILKRNPAIAKRFLEAWIPMENAYFEGTKTEKRCDRSMVFLSSSHK